MGSNSAACSQRETPLERPARPAGHFRKVLGWKGSMIPQLLNAHLGIPFGPSDDYNSGMTTDPYATAAISMMEFLGRSPARSAKTVPLLR